MNTNYLKKSVAVAIICVAGVFALSGCQPRAKPTSPTEEQLNNVRHTVKTQGETLYAIAAWYTGQGQNWKLLVDANPGLNPNRMRIGEVIRIPRKLVLRMQPMPIVSTSSKPKVSRRASAQPDAESSDTESSGTGSSDTGSSDTGSSDTEQTSTDPDEESTSTVEDLFGDESSSASSVSSAISSSSSSSLIRSVDDVVNPLATAAPVITAPAVEKRTKSRDELLQELLKDY